MSKVALISGITGQDGSYLADLLLDKGYIVHGIKRKSSSLNTDRLDHIYKESYDDKSKFHLHYGDLLDFSSILSLVETIEPDEIYNLGAQSHVAVSFKMPEYTSEEQSKKHGDLKRFFCQVKLGSKVMGKGWGGSRKFAEKEAAKSALKSLNM